MRVILKDTYADACYWVALYIKNRILKHPKGKKFVLGLPTGSTPIGIYKQLILFHQNNEISFKNVITFNMDEYVGLDGTHDQSYEYFMYSNFFNHIDIPKENINLLNGMCKDPLIECQRYENKIKECGGIDLFLMGIGSDGHIAFNEPGSSLQSETRIKTLAEETIVDNCRFFKSIDEVPKQALTVGIKTVMDAREVILVASGIHKAIAIKECIEGSISNQFTCTAIQNHPKAMVVCDEMATYELKYKTVRYYKNLQKMVNLTGLPKKRVGAPLSKL
mmetsp:Transcript_39786/g.35161  ORF Transcript_39786/g.35161 Transcript_39786/m.35161 type:complete len:277 (+) Transcript_39786:23-853(+)